MDCTSAVTYLLNLAIVFIKIVVNINTYFCTLFLRLIKGPVYCSKNEFERSPLN